MKQRLNVLKVPYSSCHPKPCPQKFAKSNITLINIRDPVDRFHSNFYWKAKLICRPNDGDTRTIGDHVGNPFEHCTTFSFADVILKKYKEDANLLAEALCSDDLHERTNAQEDMRLIGHSGWTISDWLGIHKSSKSNGTFRNVGAVVLEPGFPFIFQIDSLIDWLELPIRSKRSLYSKYGINSAARHSSKVNISIFNFSIAPPKPLSPLATCCVARHFYETDYQLLSEKDFTKQICKGSNSSICESAIEAIAERRSWVFSSKVRRHQNKSMSCHELLLDVKILHKTVTVSLLTDEARGQSTLFFLAFLVACFIRLMSPNISICDRRRRPLKFLSATTAVAAQLVFSFQKEPVSSCTTHKRRNSY